MHTSAYNREFGPVYTHLHSCVKIALCIFSFALLGLAFFTPSVAYAGIVPHQASLALTGNQLLGTSLTA